MDLVLPFALERALLGVLMLAAGVWMGGFIAIMIVSATSKKSLGAKERVALFRGLGRSYLKVAAIAFVAIIVPGVILLTFRNWDGYSLAVVLLAVVLVFVTAVAVRQARQLTRMRKAHAHAESPGDALSAASMASTAAAARVLRAGIGLLSLAIFVVVVAMP
jgi:hypothetical protein